MTISESVLMTAALDQLMEATRVVGAKLAAAPNDIEALSEMDDVLHNTLLTFAATGADSPDERAQLDHMVEQVTVLRLQYATRLAAARKHLN